MKIASSSDWRDSIPFDSPMLVEDIVPGEPTRCATCGIDSLPRPRTELWAVKHRHPKNHDGYVRFYCREHTPVIARPASTARAGSPVETGAARSAPRRAAAARTAAAVDKPRAMCTDCFIEVSATGICGMCGKPA